MKPIPHSVNLELAGLFKHPLMNVQTYIQDPTRPSRWSAARRCPCSRAAHSSSPPNWRPLRSNRHALNAQQDESLSEGWLKIRSWGGDEKRIFFDALSYIWETWTQELSSAGSRACQNLYFSISVITAGSARIG